MAQTVKVFVTSYHISVNATLVKDLQSIGLEVIMPNQEFANGRIDFYAPNTEYGGVTLIDYNQFISIPEPIAIIIPCMQLYDDFTRLYNERHQKDVLVYLTANSDIKNTYPLDGSDYIMTHDIDYHRLTKAKYKIFYFSRPLLLRKPKTESELKSSFDNKKIKLYINNFDKAGFEPEYKEALKLQSLYEKATGWRMPMYGYGMADGWLKQNEVQDHMVDSMFTVVFKRRETWGQMVNESMLLGTPCVMMPQYVYSTFKQYLINQDTTLFLDTPEQLTEAITNMTYNEYETLVNEAYSQSQMFCNNEIRHDKLAWLFDKVAKDPKMI